MSAAKRKQKARRFPGWLRRSAAWLAGPGRSATLIVLLSAGLAGGWAAVWYRGGVGRHVLSSDAYTLTPESIEILTPQPPWIDTDVRADAYRNACLDGTPSILDQDLTERIHNAFAMEPWVAKVVRVRKAPPARVSVEVVYRRPVCVVEVTGDLHLVDVHGVQLPEADFSPTEIRRYPLLSGIETRPLGTYGEYWGDPRVVGGAEIAEALQQDWNDLKLARIVPLTPSLIDVTQEHSYALVTYRGTRIHWGRAPGANAAGEPPAAEKVARLKKYMARYGTLDGRGNAPQELDVNRLPAPRVSVRPSR
jgi:hypothetical protein